MATSKDQTLDRSEQTTTNRSGRKGLLAGGGAIGAVLASACCILPLVLFSLGIGGAWMSNLTMLKPYQPLFIAFTLVMREVTKVSFVVVAMGSGVSPRAALFARLKD